MPCGKHATHAHGAMRRTTHVTQMLVLRCQTTVKGLPRDDMVVDGGFVSELTQDERASVICKSYYAHGSNQRVCVTLRQSSRELINYCNGRSALYHIVIALFYALTKISYQQHAPNEREKK